MGRGTKAAASAGPRAASAGQLNSRANTTTQERGGAGEPRKRRKNVDKNQPALRTGTAADWLTRIVFG